MIAVAMHNHY